MSFDTSRQLERLSAVRDQDPGIYVLALTAFMEGYVRSKLSTLHGHEPSQEARLVDLLHEMADILTKDTNQHHRDKLQNAIKRLRQQITISNAVRHEFQEVDREEAFAHTQGFLSFCNAFEVPDCDGLKQLREYSNSTWRHPSSNSEYADGSIRQYEMASAWAKDHEEMNQRLGAVQRGADERARFLAHVLRLSFMARTRQEWEREVLRLTPEQQKLIDQVNPNAGMVIRGGAGTGKTVCLIKILEKLLKDQRLAIVVEDRVLFLTFTKALTKYNRYLGRTIGIAGEVEFHTVDKFLGSALKRIEGGVSIQYADQFLQGLIVKALLLRLS